MQDLCVSASTKPVSPGSSPVCTEVLPGCLHCSPCWNADTGLGTALQHTGRLSKGQSLISQGLPSKGTAEERPIHSTAELPGLQATSELDHHSTGNKAQAEGFKVCTDSAGWRELIQLKVWKIWRVLFFQSTINCFLIVTPRSLTLVSFIFPFPRKVTTY